MRGTRCDTRLTTFGGFLCLSLLIAAVAAEECDKSKCKGPLKQYEMMNCQPIYNKPGDCCAVAYNCSEPFGKTSDKCYAKGREYVNFEALRNEDRENPCDNGCICVEGNQGTGVGKFKCRQPDPCCESKNGCHNNPDSLKCIEDGKIYQDGERFEKIRDGYKVSCQCMQGLSGNKGSSHCWMPVQFDSCALLLKPNESLAKVNDSPLQFRCPENGKDTIIHPKDKTHESAEHTCKFGNLTLHIGDELSEGKDSNGNGYGKCSCEVPPFVTCQ